MEQSVIRLRPAIRARSILRSIRASRFGTPAAWRALGKETPNGRCDCESRLRRGEMIDFWRISFSNRTRFPSATLHAALSESASRRLTAGGFRAPMPHRKQPAGGEARFRRSAWPSHRGSAVGPEVHETFATMAQRPGPKVFSITKHCDAASRSAGRSPFPGLALGDGPALFDIVNQGLRRGRTPSGRIVLGTARAAAHICPAEPISTSARSIRFTRLLWIGSRASLLVFCEPDTGST